MRIKYTNRRVESVFNFVHEELKKAMVKYPPMKSSHEGFAVIKEELEELWEQIKKYPNEDKTYMKKEASQVAAMAIRFMLDRCEDN